MPQFPALGIQGLMAIVRNLTRRCATANLPRISAGVIPV